MVYKNKHFIKFHKTGKGGGSLFMTFPSPVVKELNIDPTNSLLLLKIKGMNDMQLRIIREEDIVKGDTENMVSAQKFTRLPEQTPES